MKRTYNLSSRAELDTQLLTQFAANSPRLDLLLTSIRHPQNKYLFTMQDRKVYVGSVISTGQVGEAQGVDQHFLLVSFLSGYRDKDTLQVETSTDYASGEDSVIMLAQENIASAMLWKKDVWEAFKTASEAKKPKPRVKDTFPKRH